MEKETLKSTKLNKRILVLGNSHTVVFKFRGELIEELIRRGYDVWTCFPNGPFGEGETSAKRYGCHFVEIHMERQGTNPIKDVALIFDYIKIIKQLQPDIVLSYTIKPNIYGGIVCAIKNIPAIPNVTGLGTGFDKQGIVQTIMVALYKIAFKRAKCVFFQNDHDKAYIDAKGIIYPKGVVLPGSGVNLEKYTPISYPSENEPIKFLFAARIMKAKGIEQFLDAAHAIKQQYPSAEFHVCGYCEEDYLKTLMQRELIGEIFYHGLIGDIKDYIGDIHCVVLPSFYSEGMSNTLLEGAACARPLITTDHTGCREAVTNGVTGYIVRQQDSRDLINKMIKFIDLPYIEKVQMGMAGRKKIEQEFDRNIVINAYIGEICNVNK